MNLTYNPWKIKFSSSSSSSLSLSLLFFLRGYRSPLKSFSVGCLSNAVNTEAISFGTSMSAFLLLLLLFFFNT